MEIGKFYSVPHVRAVWRHNTLKWWPVIGPAHSDSEIIRYKPVHWHVDFRFLNKTDRVSLVSTITSPVWGHPLHDVFAVPISWVSPEGITIACQDQAHDHILGEVAVGDLPHEGIPPESYMRTIRRKFVAHYPTYPPTVRWLGRLRDAYQGCRLKPGMVCPHKGADLTGIKPEDGIITCPLHGLEWCAKTGELVRTTNSNLV